MKRKVFILFFILFFVFTTSVLGVNTIDSDIYTAEENTYTLDSKISGNVFSYAKEFVMLDTASITGNLYVMSDKVSLKSNVTYSNAISKDGSYSIESVNSHATIDGNVYIMCKEFVLEPGCEIEGDLYILADKIDIQKSSSIYGNLFAVSSEILLNGRVSNSVYATSNNFNMNYYGAISNDLHLTSENVTLSSVIHRNAYIDANEITTGSDFLLYENLESKSQKFNFSGEIDGDATINSKELNFINSKDGETIDCLISGDLDYSSEKEIQIENNIVRGKVNYSPYIEEVDTKPTFSLKTFVIDLITFVVYVFVVVLIFNLLNKNYKNTKHEITVKNTFATFGIGLLSFLVVAVITLLLIIIPFGLTLSLALLFAYLFLLFVAIPMFVLDIALLLKDKLNVYLLTVLIALALSLISAIPVVGGLVLFVVLITGVRKNLQ